MTMIHLLNQNGLQWLPMGLSLVRISQLERLETLPDLLYLFFSFNILSPLNGVISWRFWWRAIHIYERRLVCLTKDSLMFAAMKCLHGWLCWFSAIIVPAGRDPKRDWELWEYWVGKITDIRAIVHDENSNTVRVSNFLHYALHTNSVLYVWFSYLFIGLGTRAMVLLWQRCVRRHKIFVRPRQQTNFKYFVYPYLACVVSKREIVGKYERAFSDHFDFVQPESFNGNVHPFKGCPNTYFLGRSCYRSRFSGGRSRARLHPSPEFLSSLYSWTQNPQAPGDIVLFSQIFSLFIQSRSFTAQTWFENMYLFDPLQTWRHEPVEVNAFLPSSFMQDRISWKLSIGYQIPRSWPSCRF